MKTVPRQTTKAGQCICLQIGSLLFIHLLINLLEWTTIKHHVTFKGNILRQIYRIEIRYIREGIITDIQFGAICHNSL